MRQLILFVLLQFRCFYSKRINIDFVFITLMRKYTMIIERDKEDWFVSEVVELPGCHTQAKSMDQLIQRTKEAIEVYLASMDEPIVFEEFIGVQQVEV